MSLAAAGELRHFARVQAAPGFAAALCESIAELKTALVTPDQLRLAARARQDPALEEIALIYAAYQQRLDFDRLGGFGRPEWAGIGSAPGQPGPVE